jgi:hypothetical protein
MVRYIRALPMEKPLVSIELMQHLSLVESRERKRTHLLHEHTTTVKYSFYTRFLVLWKACWFLPLGLP